MSRHPSQIMLQQLGGSRFIAMTGAKDFLSGDNPDPMLRMRLPAGMTKDRGSFMEIHLEPTDTYRLTFFKLWKGQRRLIEQRRGVYVEQLREAFTEMTGLDVSLGSGFDRREMLTANGAG